MTDSLVLVTGGSGFIAGHCIVELLQKGFRVRTSVRSLARESSVCDVFDKAGMTRGGALEFVAADLTRDQGWSDAVAGVDAVLHVASPVRPGKVDDEDEVIGPARDGALRLLRAARDAGVRRVVLTSAFHAAGFGHPHSHDRFTEEDWSVVDVPIVDVRDVAAAHVAAIEAPEASGQRILIASGEPAIGMAKIAETLRSHLGDAAAKVPTRRLPDIVVRVGALFNVELRSVAAELGLVKLVSIDKARRLLNFSPRSSEEAIVSAGKSMIAAKLV